MRHSKPLKKQIAHLSHSSDYVKQTFYSSFLYYQQQIQIINKLSKTLFTIKDNNKYYNGEQLSHSTL